MEEFTNKFGRKDTRMKRTEENQEAVFESLQNNGAFLLRPLCIGGMQGKETCSVSVCWRRTVGSWSQGKPMAEGVLSELGGRSREWEKNPEGEMQTRAWDRHWNS